MRRFFAAFVCLTLFLPSFRGQACTLWSASGEAAGGGTLLNKNRDFSPASHGGLVLVRPREGMAFVGFYAFIKGRERLVAGVNEAGLAMVSATAGSLPRAERDVPSSIKSLNEKVLRNIRTVDGALGHMDWFAGHSPVIYMLADTAKTAWVEIGKGGAVAWRETSQGTLAHGNHFISPELSPQNVKEGPSSLARFERIQSLLAGQSAFTVEDFDRFANDRSEGPDNSIFRTGSTPQSTRTMARFTVRSQPGKPTVLMVTGYDDPAAPWRVTLTLDRDFWDQAAKGQSIPLAPLNRT